MLPQVHLVIPTARHDELSPFGRSLEGGGKVRQQLREDRNPSAVLPFVVFRFLAPHHEPRPRPVHVGPAQRKHLGRTAQPAPAAQDEDQTPFSIRTGVQYGTRYIVCHEVLTIRIAADRRLDLTEGVASEKPLADGEAEELLGAAARPADGVRRQSLSNHSPLELLGVGVGHVAERLRRAEVGNETPAGLTQVDERARLGVGLTSRDVAIDQRAERMPVALSRLGQPDRDQLGVRVGVQPGQPAVHLIVRQSIVASTDPRGSA